jgi:hypothetical protein
VFLFILMPIPVLIAVVLFFQLKHLYGVVEAVFAAWRGEHPTFDKWWRIAQGDNLPGRWDHR